MRSIARLARRHNACLCVILLAALLLAGCGGKTGEIRVSMIDVGQGDPLLLHEPGGCTALIDAGGLLHGHRITAAIHELGVDRVDLLIISHPHLDHFGAMFDLVPRVAIGRAFDNGGSNPTHEYFDDYRSLRNSLPITPLKRGDRLFCGGLEISVLYPPAPPAPEDDINGSSLALLIDYHEFRLLHLGDLGGMAEKALLALGDDLRADLLKVAHHGAGDATSAALIERVSPAYALIGCAANNRLEAPHPAVIARLVEAGAQVLRTDQRGTITLTATDDGVLAVHSDREQGP